MQQRQAFLVQTILEAIIPVLGYFYWNWDLSFILLFYLLDWLLAYGILLAKGNKRISFSRDTTEKSIFVRHSIIACLTLAAACAAIGAGVAINHPGLDWWKRTIDFLTYKELGVQQGIVLIPLIVLNGILVFRQQFLIPARYRVLSIPQITYPFLQQGWILLAAGGLLLGATSLISLSEELLIAALILGTGAYRWLVIRRH